MVIWAKESQEDNGNHEKYQSQEVAQLSEGVCEGESTSAEDEPASAGSTRGQTPPLPPATHNFTSDGTWYDTGECTQPTP